MQTKTLAIKLFETFYQTARNFAPTNCPETIQKELFKMDNGHNIDIVPNKKSPKPLWFGLFKWRRRWDSNPRYARTYDGFQDRSNQPLWHSSKVIQLVTN